MLITQGCRRLAACIRAALVCDGMLGEEARAYEGRRVPTKVADQTGASIRSLYRDIDALHIAGARIEGERGQAPAGGS